MAQQVAGETGMTTIAQPDDQGTSGPAAGGGGRVVTEALDVTQGPIRYLDHIT